MDMVQNGACNDPCLGIRPRHSRNAATDRSRESLTTIGVVKLSRERSVGLSVRAYVRRSVHCTVEKRRIGSGCRYRSDGSRDETGSGVWGSLHGKGYFWGRFGAWHCIQWGLYGVHAHYVVRFESIESLNQVIAVTYWRCSKYSKYLQNKPVGQYTSRLSRTMLTVLI